MAAETELTVTTPTDNGNGSVENLTEQNGLTFNEKVFWKSGRGIEFGRTVRSSGVSNESTSGRRFCDLFWQHKLTTTTLCFVFWCFGLCVAFLGPTLLDLGCKTSTTFSTMSWVFFSQSFFILLGSACAGIFLQNVPDDVMLLIAIFMMTTMMAVIPFCNVLWGLTIVLAFMGFFMGTIDTVANVAMINLYGKDVSPFLQTMHFFYGVGAFVSPMIAQPFLLNEDCTRFIDNSSHIINVRIDNETFLTLSLKEAQRKTHIDYAFWTMSLFMVPVILLSVILVGRRCFRKIFNIGQNNSVPGKQYENMGDKSLESREKLEEKPPVHKGYVTLVASLCAILMFLYDGLQATYGGYVYSYAVKGPVRLPKYDAAYLNALFWGTFATGRLVSIVLATKISPTIMLFGNIIGCTFGVLMILALRYSQVMLIIGTCLMGFFMSSVFPTALSLTEQYIHVTSTITSVLVVCAAIGEMSLPVIVGHEFDRKGPVSFLVISLVLCFLSVIAYMSLWLIGSISTPSKDTLKIIKWCNKCMPGDQSNREETELMHQQVLYYSRMHSDLSDTSLADQDNGIIRSELVLKD